MAQRKVVQPTPSVTEQEPTIESQQSRGGERTAQDLHSSDYRLDYELPVSSPPSARVRSRKKIHWPTSVSRSILDAAGDLFVQQGFDQTSVLEIAHRLQVSDAHILRLGGGKKEGLLLVMLQEILAPVVSLVRAVAEDARGTAGDKLTFLFREVLTWMDMPQRFGLRFLFDVRTPALLLHPLLQAGLNDMMHALDEIIRRGQREGAFPYDLPVELIRMQLIGIWQATALGKLWAGTDGFSAPYSNEEATESFHRLLRGMSSPDGSRGLTADEIERTLARHKEVSRKLAIQGGLLPSEQPPISRAFDSFAEVLNELLTQVESEAERTRREGGSVAALNALVDRLAPLIHEVARLRQETADNIPKGVEENRQAKTI